MPGFSVVTPPPISFPTVGVSTLPYAVVMDLVVSYEVVELSSLGLSLDLSDRVGLSLVDGWSYDVALGLSLVDSVDLGLSDGWVWSVVFGFDLSDSAGLNLVDGWIVWMDEIQLFSFAGFSVSYPPVVDVIDLVVSGFSVGYPPVVDVIDLVVSGFSVSYPATVDSIDLVVGAGVSVG
jgi:hypothetical protein